ncbi:MAG: 16S rRNA (guanine(966)-N(2))-methyltransferase RsmD [Actinomycetota bacterium]|nr:16S rRNA (guanine(966)-N(2))-methyltransferase RsmD [Actinomycetota bacterium]
MIAGAAKGRRLRSAPSRRVRPSGDRLKEALFSTLGPGIEGKTVLDLYAGSGALGIEALSRGAAHATFVESYPEAAAMIEQNLQSTGLSDNATVVRSSAEEFVAGDGAGPFDLVFIDPPYALGVPRELLEKMAARKLVDEGSLVVLEASSRLVEKTMPDEYRLEAERRYGDSALLYLKVKEGSG